MSEISPTVEAQARINSIIEEYGKLPRQTIVHLCPKDLNLENDSHKIRQNSKGLLAKITRGCYTRSIGKIRVAGALKLSDSLRELAENRIPYATEAHLVNARTR